MLTFFKTINFLEIKNFLGILKIENPMPGKCYDVHIMFLPFEMPTEVEEALVSGISIYMLLLRVFFSDDYVTRVFISR